MKSTRRTAWTRVGQKRGCGHGPSRRPANGPRRLELMRGLSERPLLLLLAAVQFTHIADFMILMPLGPQLMRELHIGPGHFSALVAAYTIRSGVVGLLAARFIDRFDRRKLLLFAYAGFIAWTMAFALSQDASTLLGARALSGAFGGLSI